MARYGIKGFWTGDWAYDPDTRITTYTDSTMITMAVDVDVSFEVADAKFYANDIVVESAYNTAGGAISINGDHLLETVMANLLGHSTKTVGSTDWNTKSNQQQAGIKGFAWIDKQFKNNKTEYWVWILPKTKFKDPNLQSQTMEESIDMQPIPLEGDIMPNEYGHAFYYKQFATEQAAEAAITGFFTGTIEPDAEGED